MLKALAMFLGLVTFLPSTAIILGCLLLLWINVITCRIPFKIKDASLLFSFKISFEAILFRFLSSLSNNIFPPFKSIIFQVAWWSKIPGRYLWKLLKASIILLPFSWITLPLKSFKISFVSIGFIWCWRLYKIFQNRKLNQMVRYWMNDITR